MVELRRYSDYNARYHNIKFKDYEKDDYIVDSHGNTVKIANESVIIIRDHYNRYCRLKLK